MDDRGKLGEEEIEAVSEEDKICIVLKLKLADYLESTEDMFGLLL